MYVFGFNALLSQSIATCAHGGGAFTVPHQVATVVVGFPATPLLLARSRVCISAGTCQHCRSTEFDLHSLLWPDS